ncbi:hypothetical protein [Streptomyces kronopolitis]|uniref:hypothetical protein n=1 Tax=Streptomyces kronopolitis TaxID=1612435 RepID=UPI00367E85BA
MTYAKQALAIGALALGALSGTAIPAVADSHIPAPSTAAAAPTGHASGTAMDLHAAMPPLDRHRPIVAGEGHTPAAPLDRHRPVVADDSHHPIAAGDNHTPVAPPHVRTS